MDNNNSQGLGNGVDNGQATPPSAAQNTTPPTTPMMAPTQMAIPAPATPQMMQVPAQMHTTPATTPTVPASTPMGVTSTVPVPTTTAVPVPLHAVPTMSGASTQVTSTTTAPSVYSAAMQQTLPVATHSGATQATSTTPSSAAMPTTTTMSFVTPSTMPTSATTQQITSSGADSSSTTTPTVAPTAPMTITPPATPAWPSHSMVSSTMSTPDWLSHPSLQSPMASGASPLFATATVGAVPRVSPTSLQSVVSPWQQPVSPLQVAQGLQWPAWPSQPASQAQQIQSPLNPLAAAAQAPLTGGQSQPAQYLSAFGAMGNALPTSGARSVTAFSNVGTSTTYTGSSGTVGETIPGVTRNLREFIAYFVQHVGVFDPNSDTLPTEWISQFEYWARIGQLPSEWVRPVLSELLSAAAHEFLMSLNNFNLSGQEAIDAFKRRFVRGYDTRRLIERFMKMTHKQRLAALDSPSVIDKGFYMYLTIALAPDDFKHAFFQDYVPWMTLTPDLVSHFAGWFHTRADPSRSREYTSYTTPTVAAVVSRKRPHERSEQERGPNKR